MKSPKKALPLLTMLAALCGGGATALAAEDPTVLTPIVVTATLDEKNLEVAPGAVQIIDREEISALGAETVGDVLQYATDVMLIGGEGRNLGTSIRGLGANHTLVLLDGRRLAGSFKSQMDVAQIPTLMIDRIEIVRGPVSALYGSDAIGGVVNIITLKPATRTTAEVDVRAGIGRSAEQTYQGRIGGGQGPVRGNLGASHSKKDDWDGDGELPDDIDATALGSTLGRLAFDPSEAQTLSLGGEYSHFSREGGRYYQFLDRDYRADDRRASGFAEYELHPDGPFSGLLRGYFSRYKRTSSFDPPVDVVDERRSLTQVESRGSYVVNDALLLTAGGEFRDEKLEEEGLGDDDKSTDNGALFLQGDWQISDRLNLVAGTRYDHHQNFGSRLSPRATLSRLIPGGRIWVGYGQGFRAPNLNELYVTSLLRQGLDTYRGNPDLDAETSESYETGITYRKNRLWGQLTLFHNTLKDLITTELVAEMKQGEKTYRTYEYANVDKAITRGGELEAGVRLPANFTLSGQVSYVATENRTTGAELAYEPHWKGGLNLLWRQPDWDLTTQVRWLYFGHSDDGLGETLDAYSLVHLSLTRALSKQLNMDAGVDNLFDENSEDFTLSPRQVYAGVNWRF
ncbi:MAG: hypothetical protein A2X84_10940 [Desulfuromonadaceae bacterium GWC2_58_13]|nr:MAG: hypothetical protein A2X84_10940 [Desulfuromonadaceae bacterium GWC2_58_13]